ncbi:MAG: polyphosphate kinase 1 [Gemmatimonadota bacterium]
MNDTRPRVIRYEIPDRATLERLVDTPLAGEAGGPELHVFRDIYYDTPAADLRARNSTARLRLHMDGSATLVLDLMERGLSEGLPHRRRAEALVENANAEAIFTSDTEPARLLRAMLDPTRLRPAIEVETERRTRRADLGAHGSIVLHCDSLTIRLGDLSADMFELEAHVPQPGSPRIDELLAELRREGGLRPVLAETTSRVHELIEDMQTANLATSLRSAREVAVVVHRAGTMGFVPEDGMLGVPHGPGAGTDACRSALRTSFGHARARIRLLGTGSGTPAMPSLQVWLAEDVVSPSPGHEVNWIPIDQALERAGSPGLHDARTLRALHVVARAGFRTWSPADPTTRTRDTAEPLERVLQRLEAAESSSAPVQKDVPTELLLNVELSRMAFDERILVMAEDPRVPLLERVRFLSMYGKRRDDFFMTRVARFKRMVAAGDDKRTMDGRTPSEQLDLIAVRARQMIRRAYGLLRQQLIPELARHGITIESWSGLREHDRKYLRTTYGERLEALITPVAADPMHPFPHVRNLRPALAATVRLPGSEQEDFIAVELPGNLPRFVPISGGHRFVPLEDIIKAMLPELYPGLEVVRAHTFRVTRAATVEIDDDPLDILELVAEEVARRPFQEVVRLEVERLMPPETRLHLLRELQFEEESEATTLDEQDVYTTDRLVDLAAIAEIANLDVPELHYPPRQGAPPFPEGSSMFQLIGARDRFVHFPHDSFSASVEQFLEQAASDPHVIAVKTTLYRTDEDSAVVAALRKVRENGKDALAMVELKASFDEQRNIEWARELERAGIRVAFSPPKYKVHAKVVLVLRREGDTVRRYAYIGTGNLNAATAATYVDVGIFTADPVLTQELNSIFNLLSGYSAGTDINTLLVSPFNMRERFLRLIERETEHASAGRPALIRGQVNGLADRRLISALYAASAAGVKIDVMAREICALRPGIPGISENIRISSLLGRFLQHARIFHFHNAGEDEFFIGSADWRPRNMSERVEVVTPVRDPEHMQRLSAILDETLNHPDTWLLRPDGTYARDGQLIGHVPEDDAA